MIFLHGSGDTGPGVESWIGHVTPSFLPALEREGIRLLFPSAQVVPTTIPDQNYPVASACKSREKKKPFLFSGTPVFYGGRAVVHRLAR